MTEVRKAQKLKELFAQLPEDWKENLEQLSKLEDLRKLTSDIKARGGSVEEIRQMRQNLCRCRSDHTPRKTRPRSKQLEISGQYLLRTTRHHS